jgi:putative salt-induced outer membrane protein
VKQISVIVCAFALSASAFAQSPAPAPADPWSGKVGLGYAAITGNAKSSNVTLEVDAKFDLERWHHEGTASAFRSTATDQETDVTSTTAERYALGYKVKHDFNLNDYLFGLASYERDQFGGYRRQLSEVVGYGRRLINTDRQVLNLEVGAGAKQSDLSDGTSQSESVGRLGGDYKLKLGETSEFSQKVSTEIGADNTHSEAVSAVSAKLVKNIALGVSYALKNNSNVPPGTQRTDSYTAITLQYAF